jgi:phosphate starvation-inducible protein PhoH and related proteins
MQHLTHNFNSLHLSSVLTKKCYKNTYHNKGIKTIYCGRNKSNINSYQTNNIQPTHKQHIYQEFMRNMDIPFVIGIGPAGTGKTHFACKIALEQLDNKNIKKIIITRPTISVGQNIGFLPGDIEAKMTPWLIPLYDNFVKSSNDNKLIKSYIHNNFIEICPLSYIRGRTFENCFVIADEMQNSSINEMKSLITRMGSNSKLIVNGDLHQSDITDSINGLDHLMSLIRKKNLNLNLNMIQYIVFDKDDIKRSEFVKYMIDLYE